MTTQDALEYVRCNIKKLRMKSGMSQKELGDHVGTAGQNISNIELGKVIPSIDMLLAIAGVFNVSPNIIMGYEGYKNIYEILNNSDSTERAIINKVINDVDEIYHYIRK